MAYLSDYTAGTVSVAAGGTVVTGTGTGWMTASFREGDWFIADGFSSIIQSVDSNTQLTLYAPWAGAALSGAAYRLRYMSDGSRTSAQARQLIDLLGGSGNLEAFAGLAGVPDTVPFFTGAGTMDLAGFGEGGRALMGLNGANGQFPVWTGSDTAEARDIIGTVAQSGGVPIGALFEKGSDGSGDWVRYADGTQIYRQERILSYLGTSELRNTWNWVKPFSDTPMVTIAMTGTGSATPTAGMISFCGAFGATPSSVNLSIIRITGMTNFEPGDTIPAYCIAMGSWF